MEPNWAEENLQVIRTLMERSALYRRALAPVMLSVGCIGIAGWGLGERWSNSPSGRESYPDFYAVWSIVAAIAIGVSILIIRRQALRSAEPIWTTPMKKICYAMAPALFAGLLAAVWHSEGYSQYGDAWRVIPLWGLLYGCALHSAGEYISRGVRLLAWAFIIVASLWACLIFCTAAGIHQIGVHRGEPVLLMRPHAIMGLTFGGLHLLAGIYLYFTEKGRNAQ